jgi:hypothetical protein
MPTDCPFLSYLAPCIPASALQSNHPRHYKLAQLVTEDLAAAPGDRRKRCKLSWRAMREALLTDPARHEALGFVPAVADVDRLLSELNAYATPSSVALVGRDGWAFRPWSPADGTKAGFWRLSPQATAVALAKFDALQAATAGSHNHRSRHPMPASFHRVG